VEEFQTAEQILLTDKQTEMKNYAKIMRKLQKLRDDIKGIKAEGHNSFNNFDYIQLKDILQIVTPMMTEYHLATHHKLYEQPPKIDLVDTETGYSVSFGNNSSVSPEGKNTNQKLQSLGSSETYIRRYIYLQIFDLYDDDQDSTFGKEKQQKKKTMKPFQKQEQVTDDRLSELAQLIGYELNQQKLEVNDKNKILIADRFFKQKTISAEEYRQIKKLVRGERKINKVN